MMMVNRKFAQFLASWLLVMPISCSATADDFDDFEKNFDLMTDDRPVPNQVIQPPWFKASFLDLADDLEEAGVEKKQGLRFILARKIVHTAGP